MSQQGSLVQTSLFPPERTVEFYVNLLKCCRLIFSPVSYMSQQGSLVQTSLFPPECTVEFYVNLLKCCHLIFSPVSYMSQQGSLVQTSLFQSSVLYVTARQLGANFLVSVQCLICPSKAAWCKLPCFSPVSCMSQQGSLVQTSLFLWNFSWYEKVRWPTNHRNWLQATSFMQRGPVSCNVDQFHATWTSFMQRGTTFA